MDASGGATPFTGRQRWLLLVGFALLVAFRLPLAWVHGRFLDEEATVFLAFAWHHPWAEALFRPFAGYWNVGANATTLLAARAVTGGLVPLERAPYLTMLMALAVQLLPAMLILTGRATWLGGRAATIAALLMVAIMPGTEEVFLNVLHIQFHLALCVGLILALDPPERPAPKIGYGLILLLAPLCGPIAIAFLPLFLGRALIDRDRNRVMQLAALGLGAAIQLLLFYGANPMRGHLLPPGTLAATLFVRLIAMPVVGFQRSDAIGDAINESQGDGTHDWWWAAVLGVLLFAVLVGVAARRRDAAIWLVLAGLGIAMVSFGYGMVFIDADSLFDITAGERYNFLPLELLGLALIVLAMRGGGGRPVWIALCLLLLGEGALHYPTPIAEVRDGPPWPAEVAAWRRGHDHPLAVWPAPLAADLSDTTRPCSPIGPDPARSTDPRYCESGWVAAAVRTQRAAALRAEQEQ